MKSQRKQLSNLNAIAKLYPPRTETRIPPSRLNAYRKGYIAQYKYNDVRLLIIIQADGEIRLTTRKREPVRQYRLTGRMQAAFRKLDLAPGKNHVLDGGLLRFKTRSGERPIVLWDILVHDDRYLLGTTYRERYELLQSICGHPMRVETDSGAKAGLMITSALWLAPVFNADFEMHFKKAADVDFLEGVFLKKPEGRLEPGTRERNNESWQLKVRKPRIDYRY